MLFIALRACVRDLEPRLAQVLHGLPGKAAFAGRSFLINSAGAATPLQLPATCHLAKQLTAHVQASRLQLDVLRYLRLFVRGDLSLEFDFRCRKQFLRYAASRGFLDPRHLRATAIQAVVRGWQVRTHPRKLAVRVTGVELAVTLRLDRYSSGGMPVYTGETAEADMELRWGQPFSWLLVWMDKEGDDLAWVTFTRCMHAVPTTSIGGYLLDYHEETFDVTVRSV